MSELVKEAIVSDQHGQELLGYYKQGNDVVRAALDVFDLDQNMMELVDTLQRLIVLKAHGPLTAGQE